MSDELILPPPPACRLCRAKGGGAVLVRDTVTDDVASIHAIYGHWVVHGNAPYEPEVPGRAEAARRRAAILVAGYPFLVAEAPDGRVIGYAHGSPWRSREAYRHAVEDSVYVAPDAAGRGVGRLLLAALLCRFEENGFRLAVAVIADAANRSSISLHAGFGFERAGLIPGMGWSRGRWVNSLLMSRPLGAGAHAPPG